MKKINLPKFHRQRFLLSLLESAEGTLSKIEFQQRLFWLHQKAGVSYYDFIPDTNITLLESILSRNDYKTENAQMALFLTNNSVLFTIGYEGISFEAYANRLLENNIRLLCDVRKNPFSRKFGFSKNIMSNLLEKIGIEYQHIPALGIVSATRQNLKTKADYSQLFLDYQASLPQQKDALKQLTDLLKNYRRIAITCFEKEHQMCHRHCISDYLETKNNQEVIHL